MEFARRYVSELAGQQLEVARLKGELATARRREAAARTLRNRQLVILVESGWSPKDVEREVGVSHDTVTRLVRDL